MKRILPVIFFIIVSANAEAGPLGFIDKPASGVRGAGDILQMAIPFSALVYSAAISDWQGVWQLTESSVATGILTHALKYTVREERPDGSDTRSFPSGHTSFAFAGAGYWQMRYGWYVGAPMYAAASFVGWTRVHARKHYWHDVIAGAAIGIGFNLLFTNKYPGTKVTISPTEDGARLDFSTKF